MRSSKAASFKALAAELALTEAKLLAHQSRGRSLFDSLGSRLQVSAPWLIPTAGLLTGWMLRKRKAVAASFALFRMVSGPLRQFASVWLKP